MHIVSKFHDFYDNARAHGVDKTCIYKREMEIIPIHRASWREYKNHIVLPDKTRFDMPCVPQTQEIVYQDATYCLEKKIIGFCGEFYPMIVAEKYAAPGGYTYQYLYSEEDAMSYFGRENICTGRQVRRNYYYHENFDLRTDQGVSNHFNRASMARMGELFHAYRTPVFVVGDAAPDSPQRKSCILVNPSLKSLGFMRVKDPMTAFQDIYMFLSGVIGAPPKPQKIIDDKVMAASKGHDGEYSFKKPPGKRGKNKWR